MRSNTGFNFSGVSISIRDGAFLSTDGVGDVSVGPATVGGVRWVPSPPRASSIVVSRDSRFREISIADYIQLGDPRSNRGATDFRLNLSEFEGDALRIGFVVAPEPGTAMLLGLGLLGLGARRRG